MILEAYPELSVSLRAEMCRELSVLPLTQPSPTMSDRNIPNVGSASVSVCPIPSSFGPSCTVPLLSDRSGANANTGLNGGVGFGMNLNTLPSAFSSISGPPSLPSLSLPISLPPANLTLPSPFVGPQVASSIPPLLIPQGIPSAINTSALEVCPGYTSDDGLVGEELLLRTALSPIPTSMPPVSVMCISREMGGGTDVMSFLNLSAIDGEDFREMSGVSLPRDAETGVGANGSVTGHGTLRTVESHANVKHGEKQTSTRRVKRLKNCGRRTGKRRKMAGQPSNFCHVCVRSGEQVRLVACANIVVGTCRKAVCERCFDKHDWRKGEWEMAVNNASLIARAQEDIEAGRADEMAVNRLSIPGAVWTCVHCRGQCPPSAQCKIYAKTNWKRHLILKKRKLGRGGTSEEGCVRDRECVGSVVSSLTDDGSGTSSYSLSCRSDAK